MVILENQGKTYLPQEFFEVLMVKRLAKKAEKTILNGRVRF